MGDERERRKWRGKYEYCVFAETPTHTWSVVGPMAGIHLWIRDRTKWNDGSDCYYGGIEIHYRQPPEYMKDNPPSHDECWLLKCPCWHTGSSLAADSWIELWKSMPHDHDMMLELLEVDLRKCLEDSSEEASE